MNIRNLFKGIRLERKRYCPKCGVQMQVERIKSNSTSINNSTCLQCPKCKSILFNPK